MNKIHIIALVAGVTAFMLALSMGSQEAFAWAEGYNYRIPITVDNTNGESIQRVNEPIVFDIDTANMDGTACNETTRFTDSSDIEIPFYVTANITTQCNYTALVNVSASTMETFYIYYDGSAGNPDYNIRRIAYDDFESYADSAAVKAAWGGSNDVGLDTSCSEIFGTQCMYMTRGASIPSGANTWGQEHGDIWVSFYMKHTAQVDDEKNYVKPKGGTGSYAIYHDFGYPVSGAAINTGGGWVQYDAGGTFSGGENLIMKYQMNADTDKFWYDENTSQEFTNTGFQTAQGYINRFEFGVQTTGTGYWDNFQVWNKNFTLYGDSVGISVGSEESSGSPDAVFVTLYMNGTNGNYTADVGSYVNFTVAMNESGTVKLDVNIPAYGTVSGAQPLENITQMTTIGTNYNITAYFDGNDTHEPDRETYFLNVTIPEAEEASCPAASSSRGGWCIDLDEELTYCNDNGNEYMLLKDDQFRTVIDI